MGAISRPLRRLHRPYGIARFFFSRLVLVLVLRPGELDGNVGNGIPGVVDANEQEQNSNRTDDEQCRHRIAQEHNCRDEEGGVGDERKDGMPQPVFQHRLIVCLTARPPYHDDDIGHPCETGEAQQQDSWPERLPRRAKNRGDQERGAKMHDGWRAESRNSVTRPWELSPRDQGDHHEHQSRQRRSSGAGDDVKVLPGGKRRHCSLMHYESPFDVNANIGRLIRISEEARLDDLNQRETHSVGIAQCVFLRKMRTRSSYYHISHQRGKRMNIP